MLDLHGLTKEEIEEFRKKLEKIIDNNPCYQNKLDELSEYPPKQEPIVNPKPDYVKFHSRWGR